MPLAHPFLYAPPRLHHERPLSLVPARDSEANFELRMALHDYGYGFGTTVLNLPSQKRNFKLLRPAEQRIVNLAFLGPKDRFVCTTRPPLSDFIQDDRKKVEPSNTSIEDTIFQHYWRYFDRLSRSSIRFSEQANACLPRSKKNRGEMGFYQFGCTYSSLGELDGKQLPPGILRDSTLACLLSVEELWPGGPGFVGAWGLNAIATLVWNFLLRDRYSALLENKGLTVVELETTDVPLQPDTYEWARDWHVTPLMETKVELPAVPRRSPTSISISIAS